MGAPVPTSALRNPHGPAKCRRTVRIDAEVRGARLHQMAAGQMVVSGQHLPLFGVLPCRRRNRTTVSCAHLVDGHLFQATENVGNLFADAKKCSIPRYGTKGLEDLVVFRSSVAIAPRMSSQEQGMGHSDTGVTRRTSRCHRDQLCASCQGTQDGAGTGNQPSNP